MDSQLIHHYFVLMQIDHDRDEPPRDRTGNWPYWAGVGLVIVLWAASLSTMNLDWPSVRLGALTGGVFVIVMTAITKDKVPPWMRR